MGDFAGNDKEGAGDSLEPEVFEGGGGLGKVSDSCEKK